MFSFSELLWIEILYNIIKAHKSNPNKVDDLSSLVHCLTWGKVLIFFFLGYYVALKSWWPGSSWHFSASFLKVLTDCQIMSKLFLQLDFKMLLWFKYGLTVVFSHIYYYFLFSFVWFLSLEVCWGSNWQIFFFFSFFYRHNQTQNLMQGNAKTTCQHLCCVKSNF